MRDLAPKQNGLILFMKRLGNFKLTCKLAREKRRRDDGGQSSYNPVAHLARYSKRRRVRAYDIFLSVGDDVHAPAIAGESCSDPIRRLSGLWKSIPAVLKRTYQAMADVENAAIDGAAGTFVEACEAHEGGTLPPRRRRIQMVKGGAAASTMAAMQRRNIWSAGTAVGDLESPLKKEF
eukprot:3713800-Pyramimonas_sp.AAC.1